ncbi:MAG TPA: PA2778 family cysteine peptidase [Burkholderiales bacterium]|nr:PA2778 family cysteine peptidase [Burkholderiales bacterium]
MSTPAAAGVFICAAALIAGCASTQVGGLLGQRPGGLPAAAELAGAPFFAQEDYQCGPAALAMALSHAGRAATPEALVPQVYLPARKGSLQAEMLATARRYRLVAYPLAPKLEDLLREIAAGNPVVVLQNLALDWAPQWHYAVAVGYDLDAREIVLRSGVTHRLAMSLDTFERTWARSGHWAMLALPPERLPATANEPAYLAAAAALERVAPAAARRAYETALERWPRSAAARIGLGNASYAMRDLAGAAAAYLRATQEHPEAADAWNNLAQALHELGSRDAALTAARRAVSLGGPRQGAYRDTLEGILRNP